MSTVKHSLILDKKHMKLILISDVKMEKHHLIIDLYTLLKMIEKITTLLFKLMIEISLSQMILLEKLFSI
jgi:hypothetical protein